MPQLEPKYGLAFIARAYNPSGQPGEKEESTRIVTKCALPLRCLQRGRIILRREAEGEPYSIHGHPAIFRGKKNGSVVIG